MTTVSPEQSSAERYLSRNALMGCVLAPTVLGTLFLLLYRYILYAWPAEEYGTPTLGKFVLLLMLLGLAAVLILRPIYEMRRLAKAHFINTYLKEGSSLRRWLSGRVWNMTLSIGASVSLAMLAYVVVQTYSLSDIAVIATAALVGLFLSQLFAYVATDSLTPHLSALVYARVTRAIVTVCILIGLIGSAIAQGATAKWQGIEEDEVIDIIIEEVNHPSRNVERVVGIMRYFDVTLLRLRGEMPFPIGWIVYICLLAPQGIVVYSIVCIFLGCQLNRCNTSC